MTTASISVAFRVSSQEEDALVEGRSLMIIPLKFMRFGQQFALYPDQPDQSSKTVLIRAWARCELCQNLYESQSLDVLAQLLNLSLAELREIFSERGHIFLAYLRVYLLPQPIEIPINYEGQFIPLPQTFYFSDDSPVLDDYTSTKLKCHLEKLELSDLLNIQIKRILKEVELQYKVESEKDLNWIKTISALGDRSIEQDQGKSNYQAGTDFENISKKSLEYLGFTVDEAYQGGAGGLDLFCSKPYPLVGECKAGRIIPSRTTEELIKLGSIRLGREKFLNSTKLIIGAGNPTPDVITAADEWKVSIIKAMTLQKLVELKAQYDGAINLFELQEYLQAGQIDIAINQYIQKVKDEIRLRSYIVQAVKELQNSNSEYPSAIEIRTHYNAKQQGYNLNLESTRNILIELSSPLAGYLGRVEENGKTFDRFYFLRVLPIPIEETGNWQVGDKIIHRSLGVGKITHIFGKGSKISLAIKFSIGQKILDPNMVILQKIE